MKILIVIVLILVPGLSFARTDCRAVEYPDRLEAVCTGDEKASPAPDTSAAAFQRGTPLQQAAPEQPQESPTYAAAPAAQPQTATAAVPSPQTSGTQAAPDAIVHRQGRQQYQKGMDEARAARLQLIDELRQRQSAP